MYSVRSTDCPLHLLKCHLEVAMSSMRQFAPVGLAIGLGIVNGPLSASSFVFCWVG